MKRLQVPSRGRRWFLVSSTGVALYAALIGVLLWRLGGDPAAAIVAAIAACAAGIRGMFVRFVLVPAGTNNEELRRRARSVLVVGLGVIGLTFLLFVLYLLGSNN